MTCLIFTCRRQGIISEMATSTPMTLHTQTQSSIGMPLHYGNSAHHHPSPHSPLKFLREDSVDGTLSPVSSKSAGTDTDTDMRKKVQLIHLFLHCIIFIICYTKNMNMHHKISCFYILSSTQLPLQHFHFVNAEVSDRPRIFYCKRNSHDRKNIQERP